MPEAHEPTQAVKAVLDALYDTSLDYSVARIKHSSENYKARKRGEPTCGCTFPNNAEAYMCDETLSLSQAELTAMAEVLFPPASPDIDYSRYYMSEDYEGGRWLVFPKGGGSLVGIITPVARLTSEGLVVRWYANDFNPGETPAHTRPQVALDDLIRKYEARKV